MRFTFEWYGDLVDRLLSKKFSFCGFNDCGAYEKCVIMRHETWQIGRASCRERV